MKDLLGQYLEALELSKKFAKWCKLDCLAAEENEDNLKRVRIANSMVTDMREMVRWAESGYDPRTVYSENRKDAISLDPYVLDSILTQANPEYLIDDLMYVEYEDGSKDEERRLHNLGEIESALTGLTDNEKTAFTLYRAEKVQASKIAESMGITESSVKVYVRRAEKKIQRNINGGTQESFDLAI